MIDRQAGTSAEIHSDRPTTISNVTNPTKNIPSYSSNTASAVSANNNIKITI